jgi:hypothetical protein
MALFAAVSEYPVSKPHDGHVTRGFGGGLKPRLVLTGFLVIG